jgi:hypothetical protein
MVEKDRHLKRRRDPLELAGLKLPRRKRPGGILDEVHIHFSDDNVAGFSVCPGPVAQYLFR